MKIEYKNNLYEAIILSLILIIFVLGLSNGKLSLDFEYFDLLLIAVYITIIIEPIKQFFWMPKVQFTDTGIVSNRIGENELKDEDVLGVVSYFHKIRIIGRNKKGTTISKTKIKNYAEVKKMLFETKKYRKLPWRYSFSFPHILELIYFTFLIVLFTSVLIGKKIQVKNHLPLRAIQVVEIEGQLTQSTEVSIYDRYEYSKDIDARIQLDEFPNVTFKKPPLSKDLMTKIMEFPHKKNTIKEGSNIKIKVRKEDFEKIKASASKDKMDYNIKYYSLKIDDVLMMEKMHLKEGK